MKQPKKSDILNRARMLACDHFDGIDIDMSTLSEAALVVSKEWEGEGGGEAIQL